MGSKKVFKKVVGEIQAKYVRRNQVQAVKICDSKSASDFVKSVYPIDLETREAFLCLYLNRANNVQSYAVISIGGISSTIADPKVIFQHALLANASSIILTHNHPSGNLKPSEMDIILTKKLVKVANLLEIKILDHLILTREAYFSFADEKFL